MDKELDQFLEDYDIEAYDNEEDYRRGASRVADEFERKLQQAGSKIRFAQDLIALFRFFRDANIPWQKKTMVVAALVYFIVPFDAIPDIAPFVGYLDDMGVVLGLIKFMSAELKPYYPEVTEAAPAPKPAEPPAQPFRNPTPGAAQYS
jgi:uncharacterized membrane protein YkvA (DUF1232 family)